MLTDSVAVGKPIIAKIADVSSRGIAYSVVREFRPLWVIIKMLKILLVVFYVIGIISEQLSLTNLILGLQGYIIIASAKNVNAIAGGIVLYAMYVFFQNTS